MTLINRLADDLVAWMDAAPDGVPRRVLLWIDPDRSFARLSTYLDPALRRRGVCLLHHGPERGFGQFRLKIEPARSRPAAPPRH